MPQPDRLECTSCRWQKTSGGKKQAALPALAPRWPSQSALGRISPYALAGKRPEPARYELSLHRERLESGNSLLHERIANVADLDVPPPRLWKPGSLDRIAGVVYDRHFRSAFLPAQWLKRNAASDLSPYSVRQSARWCNGSTSDSGSLSQGSNPCRANSPILRLSSSPKL